MEHGAYIVDEIVSLKANIATSSFGYNSSHSIPVALTAPKSKKRGSYGYSKAMYASRSAMVKTRVDTLVAVIEENLLSFCGPDLGNGNDRDQQIFNASTRVLALKSFNPHADKDEKKSSINNSRLSELTVVKNINRFMIELEKVPAVACREQFKLMLAQALLPNTGPNEPKILI